MTFASLKTGPEKVGSGRSRVFSISPAIERRDAKKAQSTITSLKHVWALSSVGYLSAMVCGGEQQTLFNQPRHRTAGREKGAIDNYIA